MVVICNICKKQFRKKNVLNRHLREKHYQGQVYKCNICKTCFARKERLMRHLKSVHFNIKYGCKICGMQFVEKFKYRFHMVKSHQYTLCKTCKTPFKSKDDDDHTCIVVNKTYKCMEQSCKEKGGTSYTRLNFFLRHLQTIHGISQFEEIKKIVINSRCQIKKISKIHQKKNSQLQYKSVENRKLEEEQFMYLCSYAFDQKSQLPNLGPRDIAIKDFFIQSLIKEENKKETQTSYDENMTQDSKLEGYQPVDLISSEAGMELVNNINILCIMENNSKKLSKVDNLASKVKKEFGSDEIILGKR